MRPVEVSNQDSRLILQEPSVNRCIAVLDSSETATVPAGALNVAFVDEAECSRLHDAFFGDPDITDVMTFPGDAEDDHAGDIAICPFVARTASTESGLSFQEELSLYLVHAWLHLSGMEDATDAGRSEMRVSEAALMQLLRDQNAFLEATWEA